MSDEETMNGHYNAAVDVIVLYMDEHKRRSSVNFGVGQDIFARNYMQEKVTKCPNFT